jgi:hypothetical protein
MKIRMFPSAILFITCALYSGFTSAHRFKGTGLHRTSHYHRGVQFGISGGRYHSGHSGFGFYFGLPYVYYPFPYYYNYNYQYYPPAYQYYPPVTVAPESPPVYIQQYPPVTQEYPPGYWYYCSNPQGYYPYVKECPNGWQQVEPTPPPPSTPTQP